MRWLGLTFSLALAGCYAVPAEHFVPRDETDAGEDASSEDADSESTEEAGASADAGDASKLDAKVDATLDAAQDAKAEASADSATTQDGAQTDGGVIDAGPCGKVCAEPTPVCVEASKSCVACTATNAGSCKSNQYCSADNKCVECTKNEHCTSPGASVCDPSSNKCVPCSDGNDAQCAHVSGKNVCAGAQCVQCTKDKRSACKTGDNKPAACDNALHTCTSAELGATGLCGECVSDAQCQAGTRCVQTTYKSVSGEQVVGWHCMWQQGAGSGAPADCTLPATSQPFIGIKTLGSIDAPTTLQPTCLLRASTCPAYVRYSKPCGRYSRNGTSVIVVSKNDPLIPVAEQGDMAKQYIHADDAECGGVGSKCVVQSDSTAAYKCTTGCGASTDCKSGFSCVAGPPDWCSVN